MAPSRLKAFVLSLGTGPDLAQARLLERLGPDLPERLRIRSAVLSIGTGYAFGTMRFFGGKMDSNERILNPASGGAVAAMARTPNAAIARPITITAIVSSSQPIGRSPRTSAQ